MKRNDWHLWLRKWLSGLTRTEKGYRPRFRPALHPLEDRTVPAPLSSPGSDSAFSSPPPFTPTFDGGVRVAAGDVTGDGYADIVAAAGPGAGPHVRVFDGRTGQEAWSFFAYDPAFTGGVYVAVGDVTGDGQADIVTGADAGAGSHVRVFDGATRLVVGEFYAYDSGFTGGVRVAVGDVTGDGRADIVTGAGAGGGPHVRVFDGITLQPVLSFMAGDPDSHGGVSVAVGDVTGDGRADIVTGSGVGANPTVRVFDTRGGVREAFSLQAYDPSFAGGVWVASADVTGDGRADIVTGAGAGAGPHVRVFDGRSRTESAGWMAYSPTFRGGVFVAAFDLDGDGAADPITGAGAGAGPHVRASGGATRADLASFFAFGPLTLPGGFSNPAFTSPPVVLPTVPPVAPPTVPPPPPSDGNTPPTISDVVDQASDGQVVGPLLFTVGDAETMANDLVVTAASDNPGLVGVSVGGSGANRTVTLTPAAGQRGSATITLRVADATGATAADTFTLAVTVPMGPPPPPPTSTADFGASTAFLYTGPDAVQTGVAVGTIQPLRAAVVRGRVLATDSAPLAGVVVTVLGHPEFGRGTTRADGWFDMAVNGGGPLVVKYDKPGLLSVQRTVDVPWRDFEIVADVVLTALDANVTTIDLSAAAPFQVARGTVQTDRDGTRQATLLFPQGVQATMRLANGPAQTLTSLDVRATEYTVGPTGPLAMPGTLPPTSAYTYAVELSIDQALAAGATRMDFTQVVPFYVENFLNFPVGMAVPTGYYDRERGVWIASDNGRVVRILSESGGRADLDGDGDGSADGAAASPPWASRTRSGRNSPRSTTPGRTCGGCRSRTSPRGTTTGRSARRPGRRDQTPNRRK